MQHATPGRYAEALQVMRKTSRRAAQELCLRVHRLGVRLKVKAGKSVSRSTASAGRELTWLHHASGLPEAPKLTSHKHPILRELVRWTCR